MVKAMLRDQLGLAAKKPDLTIVGAARAVKVTTANENELAPRLRPMDRRRIANNRG